MGLTIKQERFAQKYVELGNASEAYRQSYDCEKSSDEVIWNEASTLLKNHEVSIRVDSLKSKAAEKHEVTVDTIHDMLKQVWVESMAGQSDGKGNLKKDLNVARQTAVDIAKLHNLSVDRVDNHWIVSWEEPHAEGTDSV